MGASGGILTSWNPLKVDVWVTMSMENYLVVKGRFIKTNLEFYVAYVYALLNSGG